MDHTASEFYHIRHQLLLINPYEMIFMLSAPAVILWSVLRRKSLPHYLLLGAICVLVLYPTSFAAMSLHWDLISRWQASAGPRPVALEGMLTGNGPKMIMLVATGWGLVAVMYAFWLLVLSPAVYLSGRKRGPVQRSASEVPPGDGRLVLSGPRAVAGVVSEIFIVLGVVAALAAGPCVWVSLQSDAPPMARPMIPMFFVVGVSFLAVGLLARGIESAWAAKLSLAMAVENGSSHRRMSPSVKCAIVVAGGGMALLMILGWSASMLAVPIILALLLAGLSVLVELIHGGHRTRYHLWQRVASLAGTVRSTQRLGCFVKSCIAVAPMSSARAGASGTPPAVEMWAPSAACATIRADRVRGRCGGSRSADAIRAPDRACRPCRSPGPSPPFRRARH